MVGEEGIEKIRVEADRRPKKKEEERGGEQINGELGERTAELR